MAVLAITEMIELKELVRPYGYVVHIHDACGGQSFTLELVDENPGEQVQEVIESFFSKHRMTVTFYGEKKLDFVAK